MLVWIPAQETSSDSERCGSWARGRGRKAFPHRGDVAWSRAHERSDVVITARPLWTGGPRDQGVKSNLAHEENLWAKDLDFSKI